MDSDSIFYGIFIVAGIIFSVLDSKRKAKQNKESSRPQNRPIQPPPVPVAGNGTKREDEEDWFDRDDNDDDWDDDDGWDKDLDNDEEEESFPQSVPPLTHPQEASPLKQLERMLKDVRQDAHTHSSTPPPLALGKKNESLSKQQNTVRSITFETPEMEGQRATPDAPIAGVDEAYSQTTDSLPTNSNEWKKAIIAHEILKRKF